MNCYIITGCSRGCTYAPIAHTISIPRSRTAPSMTTTFNPPLPQDTQLASHWQQTFGCATSLALANAAANSEGPLLLICQDNESVEQFKRELRYFCSKLPNKANPVQVFSLPDWETLPYDNFSPHQDIVSDRLSALYHLPDLQQGILVTSIGSLMHKLPPKKYIRGNSLDLAVGQQLSIQDMRSRLVDAGYQSVDSVFEHGEFAVRGSILDIYPMGSRFPYRIDLLGRRDRDAAPLSIPRRKRSDQGRIDRDPALAGARVPARCKGHHTAFRSAFPRAASTSTCVSVALFIRTSARAFASPGLEYYLALFYEALRLGIRLSCLRILPAASLGRPRQTRRRRTTASG